jgi:hypothetical protein
MEFKEEPQLGEAYNVISVAQLKHEILRVSQTLDNFNGEEKLNHQVWACHEDILSAPIGTVYANPLS